MRRGIWLGLVLSGVVGWVEVWGQSAPERVSGGAMAGLLVERTDPVYPPIAKAAGVTGAVVLHAIVDETGHVAKLQVVSGPEMLRMAAMEAVRTWIYKPFVLNGIATVVDTTVTVNFQLASPREAGGPGQDAPPVRMAPGDGQKPEIGTAMVPNTFCGSPRVGEPGYHQRVSGGVMQGLLQMRVEPVYPQVDASGAVVMTVCVDAMGAVERVRVVSGPEVLRDAAGSAVSEWQYRPYLLNGEAVPVSTTVTVMFSR